MTYKNLTRLGAMQPDALLRFVKIEMFPEAAESEYAWFQPFASQVVHLNLWRKLPYGYWFTPCDSIVFFDRDYCPIVQMSPDLSRTILPPLKRINWSEQDWFYEDATAPYLAAPTLPKILSLAAGLGVMSEIEYRWHLSAQGGLESRNWGKEWKEDG